MSLTQTDLQSIREIVHSEIKEVSGEVKALREDVKELYSMISTLVSSSVTEKEFSKLPLKQQLLKINANLVTAAKNAGVNLPRQ